MSPLPTHPIAQAPDKPPKPDKLQMRAAKKHTYQDVTYYPDETYIAENDADAENLEALGFAYRPTTAEQIPFPTK
jgi:hypothetical protein